MLNDCWPAASGWSLIDYYGEPKAAYYSFKRAAKPVILSVDLEKGKYNFHICNDGEDKSISLKWYAVAKSGAIVKESDVKELYAEANTSFIALTLDEGDIPEDCFVVAEIDGDRAFYKKGRLEVITSDERVEIFEINDGFVRIKSNAYIHALELSGDAVFEENYFSLLPGEEKKVKFKKAGIGKPSSKAYTI